MKLPDEVVDYCLRYLRRDLPTLMAVLDALDVWSLTEKTCDGTDVKKITTIELRNLSSIII